MVYFSKQTMASQARGDSFLEDFSPLSQALMGANTDGAAHLQSRSVRSVFVTIDHEKCFKTFDSMFSEGPGNVGISFALDEICGMETLRNIYFLAHDISNTMSAVEIKKNSSLIALITFKLLGITVFLLNWK